MALALWQATPTAGVVGRCDSPAIVGDLFPGERRDRDGYVVLAVRRLENSAGTVVGWEYDAEKGIRFVQPTPAMSAKDGTFLRVKIPAAGIGSIYPLRKLPPDLHAIACH